MLDEIQRILSILKERKVAQKILKDRAPVLPKQG
jgi:hypothetical protein